MFAKYRDTVRGVKEKVKVEFTPNQGIETTLERLPVYIKYLESLTTYQDGNVERILQLLKTRSTRERNQLVAVLKEHNFLDVFTKMVQTLYEEQCKLLESGRTKVLLNYSFAISALFSNTNSPEFTQEVAASPLVPLLISNLTKAEFYTNRKVKDVASHLRTCFGVLSNIIRKYPESREVLRDYEADKAVMRYLKDDDAVLRIFSLRILVRIADEKEAKELEDNDSIPFAMGLIRKALAAKNMRINHGSITFGAGALLKDLPLIAANDGNKLKILEEGGLELLIGAMKVNDIPVKEGAVQTVYALCFRPTKEKIKASQECIDVLKTLRNNHNAEIRKAARGALFQLSQSDEEKPVESTEIDTAGQHVFISYSWTNKDVVWRMSEELKKDGYKVWIDKDEMEGSTLEAMATAVENAWVVLICVSAYYKESSDCRTEAEYTYKKRKRVVPVMLQRKYEMDGWLGALIGSKLYVDFTKWAFAAAYQKLVRQISGAPGNKNATEAPALRSGEVASKLPALPPPPASPASQVRRRYHAAAWTNQQVHDWLTATELRPVLNNKLLEVLKSMNGKRLVGFCALKDKAPEYFMKQLSKQYDADILQVTDLLTALDELP